MIASRLIKGACLVALTAGAAALPGCNSAPEWKETTDQKSITTGGLDIQNFNNAARELTTQMLSSQRVQDELTRAKAENRVLPLVKITRIKNDTGLKINMVDYLVTPIEEVVVNSGKADFFSEDKTSQDLAAAQEMLKKFGARAEIPDFTLHGTVTTLQTADGRTMQNAYVFQLRMTDTRTNRNMFVGSKQILKQGR